MFFMPPLNASRSGVLLLSLMLAACAGLPADHGRRALDGELSSRLGGNPSLAAAGTGTIDARVSEHLAVPLSPEAAVEIAFLLSPRVKAELARLGVASADLFESQRPRNPGFSVGRIGDETTFGLHLVLGDLLTLPSRRGVGQAQWQAALSDTAAALLDEATEVRHAYFRYQAADQVAAMRAAVAEASELSAEMARRFHAAGNISALQLAREQASATMAATDAARARVERLAARMALAERLGLAGRSNRWRLPAQLPLPGDETVEVDALLALAADRRPDLAAARAALVAGDRGATLARRLRYLGSVELGIEHERDGSERNTGAEIEFELPIFSQGQGAVRRAEAARELALQRAELVELGIQRDVRTGVARLATQREIIDTYREVLIPQRVAIVAREMERYNFMLIGVFELLEAKRGEYDAYQGYLEAIRDYWLAHADLARAVGGRLPGDGTTLPRAPGVEEILAPPADAGHDHHH
jgi:outer membrane protein, heavy metal efflux system